MKKILLTVLTLLLVACNATPTAPAAGSALAAVVAQSWIDAPLPETAHPFAPLEITAHFYHPAGVKQIEFSINGAVLQTLPSPNPKTDFVYLTHTWQPAAPGTYSLSLRAQSSSDEWGNPASITVSIGEVTQVVPTTAAPRPVTPTITSTAQPIISITPTNTPPRVIISITPSFTPSPLSVTVTRPPTTSTFTSVPPTTAAPRVVPTTPVPVSTPSFGTPATSTTRFDNFVGCGNRTEVTINVAVTDVAGLIRVVLFYRVGATGSFSSQSMSNSTNNIWTRTLRAAQEVPTNVTGTLEYYVVATNSQGRAATSPTYRNVTYGNCKP